MIKSAITAKFRTTLPSGVRKALELQPGDNLAYVVEGNRVLLMKAELFDRAAALTEGIEVDLDAPIEGEVAI